MREKKLSNKEIIDNLLFKEYDYNKDICERQKQILNAAIKVFSLKGFQGSRTSDIAREANVSEGTIFNYYKCKKDLLIGILIQIIVDVINPVFTLSLSPSSKMEFEKMESIEEKMHRLMLDRLIIFKENYKLIRTILVESMYDEELSKVLNENIYPRLMALIDSYVEENIENGNFKDIGKNVISRSIIGSIISYVILSRAIPSAFAGENDEEEVKKIVDIILYGITKEKN